MEREPPKARERQWGKSCRFLISFFHLFLFSSVVINSQSCDTGGSYDSSSYLGTQITEKETFPLTTGRKVLRIRGNWFFMISVLLPLPIRGEHTQEMQDKMIKVSVSHQRKMKMGSWKHESVRSTGKREL